MRNLKYHIERNIVGIPADRGQVKMKAFLLTMAMLLACIVVAEAAPYSADIRNIEGFDELVRDYLQAVQRDSHMEKLTCAECQGNTARNCTLVEREVQCNTGEVCTTLEAFNLDTVTTTVTRGCFNLTGLNCYDSPGCNALNTTGNVQSCAQFCCRISLCNAGTLTTETPPTTPPTTLAPTTPLVCDAILGQSGNFTSPNFPADYPNGVTCIAVANVPANRQMRFSVDFIQLADPGDTLIISDGSVVVLRFTGPLNRVVKRSVDDQSSYESTESYNNNQDYKDYYHFDGRRKEEPYLHVRHKRRSGNVVTITGRGQNATVTFNVDGSGSAAGFLVSFEERAVSEPETEKEKETESEPESEGEGSDDPSDDDK